MEYHPSTDAKVSQSGQISAGRTSQKTTGQHFFASPERIQSSKATNMLSDLRIAISKNPLIKPVKEVCSTCHGPNTQNGPHAPTIETHTHHAPDSECVACHKPKIE